MAASADALARSSFLVLLSLVDQPRHGLAIVERVDETSNGEVRLGPGTLYGTLHKLAAEGLIKETGTAPDPASHDPRRRYYRLTARGQRALKGEAVRLRTLVRAAVACDVLGEP